MSEPLSEAEWKKFYDDAGRITNSTSLRKQIFQGGVAPGIRKEVWRFLLGYHAYTTTRRERAVIDTQKRIEYAALKQRWKELLEPETVETSSLNDLQGDDQYQFEFIQAMMAAARHEINETAVRKDIKVIDKDVPRTDRTEPYYSGEDNIHLTWLRNILVTYAVFHPQVGYGQGMNDILSLILYVMDDEADAYWCFEFYMGSIRNDFVSAEMMTKIVYLRELIELMDNEFAVHMKEIDDGYLVFCHRWLILSFKREFVFQEAIRLFEMLCTHHLELTGLDAERIRDQVLLTESEKDQAKSLVEVKMDVKFTFDLFVCFAILSLQRDAFMKCKDVSDIYNITNELVGKLPLERVLAVAESAFFSYCRKSATIAAAQASPTVTPVKSSSAKKLEL